MLITLAGSSSNLYFQVLSSTGSFLSYVIFWYQFWYRLKYFWEWRQVLPTMKYAWPSLGLILVLLLVDVEEDFKVLRGYIQIFGLWIIFLLLVGLSGVPWLAGLIVQAAREHSITWVALKVHCHIGLVPMSNIRFWASILTEFPFDLLLEYFQWGASAALLLERL